MSNRPPLKATDPRAWGACWSDTALADAFAGRDAVPIAEALRYEGAAPRDRVWLGCHYLARHDLAALVAFAERCARCAAAAAAARYAAAAAAGAAARAAARAQQIAWLLEAVS